jgi:hypothetical protein
MPVSQNGWPANNPALESSQLVPGTLVKITVRKDAAGQLLLEVASAFDRLVQDIDNARGGLDDWGYAQRPIRGGSTLSNHASGTAIDLNATKHPLATAPSANFTVAQIAQIHRIVAVTGGVVRWGGDYTGRKDGMHFEVNDGQTLATCARALAAMRQFNSGQIPAPTGGVTELSAEFEAAARARWPREDQLEADLRGDLHNKQVQLDKLTADVAELKASVAGLAARQA